MSGTKTLFDTQWDIDKYKCNYDPEHWGLCRAFMKTHKTKYSEQKLAHLTEAFYQMGVYGSSYDPKTTRLVNALTVEVLDEILKSHPGLLYHPFKKSAVAQESVAESQSLNDGKGQNQSSSIWDVKVDENIIANVLIECQLKELFKGFIIIYDIRSTSTLNDNKVSILEESFKRSKFGPCHWTKDDTGNNICPIRIALKWRNVVLAEAVGSDEKSLKTRLAQAILSKLANFSSGIEAKWSYYRDGRLPDGFDHPNPKKNNFYKVMRRSQFKAMAEILSFIDTFANSDSFAESAFSLDFSNQEKKQLIEYIDKNWCTKLTYRTLSNKIGVKNKSDLSHVFVYHIRSGEELRRWLEQSDGENDRYRIVPPGKHRRAGACDVNVREVLKTDAVGAPKETSELFSKETRATKINEEVVFEKGVLTKRNIETEVSKKTENKAEENVKYKNDSEKNDKENKTQESTKSENSQKKIFSKEEEELAKLLDGFVLFYDANKTSEIDKDDWFNVLCNSFNTSKFGPLEVIIEGVKPKRTRYTFKWRERTLASAEGMTSVQAKTAATLQLLSKLEPFTYIIQAKENYFHGGKVPHFLLEPNESYKDFCRVVKRDELPSYYTIFQTIDEFARNKSHGELIFGPDFPWELKNEIVVYLKTKGLDHRYFTQNDQKPWTHMAVYHTVKPDELKDYLLKNGGENKKYKLIPPPKAELLTNQKPEENSTKEPEKPSVSSAAKDFVAKVVEKRKVEAEQQAPPLEDIDVNKIQIKLKKFKVDKVHYPEDTGGDFPGLIIWIGIRKNSTWQKNLYNILLESFKMSKFGELLIEESEENVWGKKEPLKKCVIKSSRKVLAVGLGESKAEAKNSASLQVLRQLRKHCYTIQAKESYFKEGKATPYDFNPDPKKAHVYKVIKRNTFRDRAAMTKYVNDFAKNPCPEEIIFGDDFTYDEREHILDHCRKIDLNYRLMKCQSVTKNMHTHIAIFHQQPLPVIKADLIKAGGENDMYRLIHPGGIITNQNNQVELWPESLWNVKPEQQIHKNQFNQRNTENQQSPYQQNTAKQETSKNLNPIPSLLNRTPISGSNLPSNVAQKGNNFNSIAPPSKVVDSSKPDGKQIPVKLSPRKPKNDVVKESTENQQLGLKPSLNQPICPQPLQNQPLSQQTLGNQTIGPQFQFGPPQLQEVQAPHFQEVPFGPQSLFSMPPPMYGQPFMDTPLQFGPNPPSYLQQYPCEVGPMGMDMGMPTMTPQMEMVNRPNDVQIPVNTSDQINQSQTDLPSVTITVPNSPQKMDLREELAKKRQAENRKGSPDRIVYNVETERELEKKEKDGSDGWSRKVFVAEVENNKEKEEKRTDSIGQTFGRSKENSQDLREKLRHKDASKDTKGHGGPIPKKNSPSRNFAVRMRRSSPGRFAAAGTDRRRIPEFDHQRMFSDRNERRDASRENRGFRDHSPDIKIIRHRESSHERRVFHETRHTGEDYNRFRSRSRSPSFSSRTSRRFERSPSPTVHFRDLWDNIPPHLSEAIFMYKYVKQDSKTETDPYALLRATRSPSFNVDFDLVKEQTAIDEYYVCVELITDDANIHPLVGEGKGRTERDASLRAARHAVDTIHKACRVIEPNYRYFCEGGVPEFIARKYPMKTPIYEIIQNMDPETPLARYTIEMMFKMFISSDLEDLFFLATDFSYLERVLVIEMATQMNLWWRLFGPRHPDASPDDIVSTQHVCVFKQKSALQLIRELLANGGSSEKYTIVDPREYRLSRSRFGREPRGYVR